MNATSTIWLTPGALATAFSASATILTPTSLPFAIETRPLPRSVGRIRSQFAPRPVAATLPVRKPRRVWAASIFCERKPSSIFRFLITSVVSKVGTSPNSASASAVIEPPNKPTLSGRADHAVVEVCRRQIEIVVRNILQRSIRRADRRTQSRRTELAVRSAVDVEPADDIAIGPVCKYLREPHRVGLQRIARAQRT